MGAPGFEAIVLAGGLGTRISSVVADRPKVMAQVAGRRFVEFLLGRMARQELTRVNLATGHLHTLLEAHFGERWGGLEICYSREDRPLGTGGAVWKALEMAVADDVLVLNRDTLGFLGIMPGRSWSCRDCPSPDYLEGVHSSWSTLRHELSTH